VLQFHYYQPMWTLVGAGIKTLDDSAAPMKSVLPSGVVHYEQRVQEFDPEKNAVVMASGQKVPVMIDSKFFCIPYLMYYLFN